MLEKIQFRPHHFLCTFCFQGNGYSSKFIKNYKKIVARLNEECGDQTPIEVVSLRDSICAPCPHRKGDVCADELNTKLLDDAHTAALNVQPGDVLNWGEAKKRILEKVTAQKFHEMCATCSWKSFGICETVLKNSSLVWEPELTFEKC